jgi:replicative DNA helicase
MTKDELINLMRRKGIRLSEFHNIDSLVDEYIDYAEDIEKKKINIGFPKTNEIMRGLRTQELLTVIGGTGVGKSVLALNFLLNFVTRTNELTIYFSLEMSSVGIGERIFQRLLDMYGFEVEKNFVDNNEAFIQACRELSETKNNFIVIPTSIDISKIPTYVEIIESLRKQKARLIAVDHLNLVENKLFPANEYARVTDNIQKIYAYAEKLDVAMINLSQTSRADVKGVTGGLTLYSGKSSGAVENSSDFVITIDKVEEPSERNSEETEYFYETQKRSNKDTGELDLLKLKIQKNRRGRTGVVYTTMNRKNLVMEEMDLNDPVHNPPLIT